MAKQLNVNLSFNADTKQAKADIEALSKALQTIAKMPGNASSLFDDTEIKKASQAALELQQHLSKAVNTDTGKLDLSHFSSSLKASNKDLSTYCNTLLKTGQQGQQAFLQLAKAIASADTPVTRVNKKLAEMGTTLKNTARWQISSSILHGFMGSVQSAYGYAQDLNRSLNDIRIVTGQNIEQMSKFAVEANRAAKALSTTTTDYTNASLIYFQQGLSVEEVAKRTEVTVKMANAAGVSAQVASDQLTAVWNNFYDGSKSLEYYADVMTALGAATASSTDEIAGGLEKFAAIGETIGLSYEYAASALATITSNTRQSEEVVGTALKTIFARIQGLNLGETLDDGTTLNKYSAALDKVGISIFQQNGEIKKMDDLLDEMASKWGTLAKDQQIALAQTVAGVRQYTQLVALMDNWNAGDSDSMVANLNTSYNASGTLQEQADIYAESWEAAQDRVRAAAENIYDSLINDEFFIDLLNGFEHTLESVGGLVDGLGGLKGIIGVVGSVFLTNFAQKVPEALNNLKLNLMVLTGQSKKVMSQMQSDLNIVLKEQQANPALSESYKIQLEGIAKVNSMKEKLVLASKSLTEQEKAEYQAKINNVAAMYEEVAALAEKKRAAEQAARAAEKTATKSASRASTGVFEDYNKQQDKISNLETKVNDPNASQDQSTAYTQALETARQKAVELELQIESVKEAYSLTDDEVDALIGTSTDQEKLAQAQKKIEEAVKNTTKSFTDQIKQRSNLEGISTSVKSQAKAWQEVAKEIKKAQAEGNTQNLNKHIDETKQKMSQYLQVLKQLAQDNGIELTEQELAEMANAINGINVDNVDQVTDKFSNFAQVISSRADTAIDTLDASIDELRSDMAAMQFNENEIAEMEQSAERAAEATQELSNSMSNIGGLADENVQGTFKMSVALTEFASTAMSVSSLITSVQSSMRVFADEGATGFEKFGAALSMIMPLLSTYNALQALSTTLSKQDKIAKLGAAAGQMAANAMAAIGIGVKNAETGAVVANTAAWYANPIMWIALIVVGVVAALAALVAVIGAVNKALADAYNADAIAAEKAENAAKNLGEAYNTVKQEYEDMIAAMENYQSARDALDELTKGTEEYEDALKEANRAAMELINKYGLIEGEHYKWDGNELVINEDAMDKVMASKEAEVDEAYAASQMANANAKSARAQANLTETRREIRDDNGLGTGDLIWKGLGTTLLNSILPGVGSLVMANEVMKSAEMDANIAKAVEEAKTNQNLFDTKEAMAEALNIDINDDKLVDALWANQEEIKSLAQEMNAAEAAWKLAAQNSANELLNDNEAVQNSNNTEEVMAVGGKVYGAAYDEAYNKYLSDAQSRGLFNTGTEASKAAFEEYAKKAGLDQLKNFQVTNYKGDGTVEYKYIDEEGKEQVKLATAEEIAATLAAAEAATQLGASAEKLVGIFNTLDDSSNEAAQALKNIIAYGNVDKATRAEFQDLQEEYENADDKTAYLNEAFGGADGVIDEEELKALGYESIEALQAGVEAAIENGEDAWDDVGKSLTDTARTAFKNSMKSGMFDDLTLEQTNQMANLFKEAFENGGVEGLNSLQSNLSVMFEKSGKDASEMAAILGRVDWQTTNIEDLTAMLEEAGIETDGFADELANLIELMQEGQNIGFDGAAEIYKTAHEIIDDLETGDTISGEDYENLKAMGINMSDYFVQMADGSYKLTADAKEFYDIVNSKSLEQFQHNIQNLTQQKNDVNALQNSGYTKDSIATMETKGVWGSIVQDNDKLGDQLTFLKAIGSDLENLDSYIQEIENGGQLTQKQLREIRAELEENAWQWENLSEVTSGFDAEIQRNMDAYAMSAQTIDDLNDMLREGLINAEAYDKAVQSVMEMEFESEGLDVDAANEVAEAFQDLAESGAEGTEVLLDNAEALKDATVRYMELNEAIEDIYDNYDDYTDVLKTAKKATTDFDKALLLQEDTVKDLRTSLAKLLGTSEDLIDVDLMAAIDAEDFEAAANGNIDAIERIREAFIKLQIEGIDGVTLDGLLAELNAFNDGAYIDLNNMPMLWSLIEAKVAAGATAADIEALLSGLNIDADVTDFCGTMEEMAAVAEQAGSRVVQSTSFSQKVDTETVDTPQTVTNYGFTDEISAVPIDHTNYISLGDGLLTIPTRSRVWQYSKTVTPQAYEETTNDSETAISVETTNGAGESGNVSGIQISGAHKAPTASKTPSVTNTSRPSVSSSSGGGGSSSSSEPSKATKMDTTKKTDMVTRYKEIDDALDDLSDAYDRASMAADRLWGENRLDALREQNNLIKEQQELLAEKQKQAQQYMQEDQVALQQAAAAAGLSFAFDDKGNIINYTDQMTILYDQLAAAEAHYNSLTTGEDQDSYEETILDPLNDKIEEIESAIELYEESKELFEELGLSIEELQDTIMQNNYDIIMEGLELRVSFNEEDLEVIDYYLSKIEDDFYSMAEAAALIANAEGNSQLTEYIDNLEHYKGTLNDLNQAYAAGEISEALYQEGLEEVRAGIRDNLSSLVDLDNTMKAYYGETLSMAQDELAKYTDRMEHQTEVLEHYQSLMETLGKETDYNSLGIILEGQAKTIENQMKVAKEAYAMYQSEADEKKKLLDQAIAAGNTEAAEVYQKEWEAANTAAMEAQQDMLDKTEEWAEALRAILENKLSGFAQDLENALTGGTSFDTLTTSMERAASLQEEYLTTTNQIYETNKLMRTAQQAIDASTSSIAKNRLKQFINETKQLQDQNKLSQYELEIQQAKYNLLLAEMALEDARDAKTVVRLKRDNEGNLGYVYTADQDKLAEAQQELEDAQNSLYNIGLEGANEYSEKYQQTMSEMYDTFTELQEQYLSGEFETEAEYQDAMLKAKEYYYEKLKNYSSLHQVALTTDARVVADAWSTEYSDMIFNTEDWMRHVTDYVHNVNDAFTEWNNNVDMIANETLGPDLDSLESNVKDITNANDELTKSITGDGGVIDAIEEELDQVSNLTGKYATLRQQIQGLIADHEQMMVRMGNEPNPYTPPGTGTAGSGSSGGSSSSGSGGSSSSGSSSSGGSSGSGGAYGSSGSGNNDVNAPEYSDLTKQGVALAIWNGGFGWGNGTTRRNRLDEKGFDPEEIQRIVDVTNPNGDWRTRYGISDLTKYAYSSFNTGGYTGAWGSYGKFAMLHEKELVLNPGETENFLASMEVLRGIIKMIDLQSTASQLGGLLHSPGYYAPQTSEVLEQNVHIEASFPEATDRYEIEAALTSIVNRASQFANRK